MSKVATGTYQLAEAVSGKLGGKVSPETVMLVWANVGSFISSQLVQGKAVKVNKLGTFTFNNDHNPALVLSNEMSTRCTSRQPVIKPMVIPTVNVNFAQVGKETNNLSREAADTILNTFMSTLIEFLIQNRTITLTMRGLIDMSFENSFLKYSFSSELMESLNAPKPSFNGLDTHQQAILNKSLSQSGLQQQQRPNSSTSYENKNLANRNPIFGDAPNSASRGRPNSQLNATAPPAYLRSRDANDIPTDARVKGGTHKSSSGMKNVFSHDPTPQTSSGSSGGGSSSDTEVIKNLKAKIIQRGGANGIKSISKLFMIMDNNGDKKLNKEELKYGLKDYGIETSPTELDDIFSFFDRDKSGTIDLDELLIGLKGDLNEKRRQLIRMAFNCLDKDGSGEISTEELTEAYDFTHHPEVRAGKMTVAQALKEFMKQWDRLNPDGIITIEEFEDYYKGVSSSIDRDDYFELMIRNAWRIAGGEGQAANTANKRVLVTNKDGTQSVQTLEKELGWKQGDLEGLKSRLGKQGIDTTHVELHGGIDTRPKGSTFQARPGQPAAPAVAAGSGRVNNITTGAIQRPSSPAMLQTQKRAVANTKPPSRVGSARSQLLTMTLNENAAANGGFDPIHSLLKLLYQPKRTIEQLATRIGVSSVSNPRIPEAAFSLRLSSFDASLTRDQLQSIWKCVDPKGTKSITLSDLHEFLSSRFGKDKDSIKQSGAGSNVVEKARMKILERCGSNGGIKGLQRTLAIMDDNGNKRLDREEVKTGLRDYGIELNVREMDELFNYFDRDHSGEIDFDEFLIGIRGDMNDRRKNLVRMAFNILDSDGSGQVTIEEVMAVYDVSKSPDVISGKKTPKEAIQEFMLQWEGTDRDGIITYEEFEDYYKAVSASIDGDDYFELMIRNAWRIAGGEGQAANTANKRVLVTNKDGTQSVQTLEKELGWKQGDLEGLKSRLGKQGIDTTHVELHGGIDTRPKGSTFQRPKSPLAVNRNGNTSGFSNSKQQQATTNRSPNNSTNDPREQFTKNIAATKMANIFRTKLAKAKVDLERRKRDALERERMEAEIEANRPKPTQINRPKPRRSGF